VTDFKELQGKKAQFTDHLNRCREMNPKQSTFGICSPSAMIANSSQIEDVQVASKPEKDESEIASIDPGR
jgi:hypothetical protein